jgi:alanine racemase
MDSNHSFSQVMASFWPATCSLYRRLTKVAAVTGSIDMPSNHFRLDETQLYSYLLRSILREKRTYTNAGSIQNNRHNAIQSLYLTEKRIVYFLHQYQEQVMITAEAVIDLEALSHNYMTLKQRSGGQKLIAVIKGDAYGHGAVTIAKALSNADMFAVSRIEEAIELRDAGITQPILLLEGCFCMADLQRAAELNFHTSVHGLEQLKDLEASTLSRPLPVWLKVDTGMHRLGVQADEVADYVMRIEKSGQALGSVGFMSHFSRADDKTAPTTLKQIAIFNSATSGYPGPKTLANSAGILYWNESQFDVARAGIALYGISPDDDELATELGLKPVMTLQSKLIAVRRHNAGQPVGYGETWTSSRDTIMGVVAMGYGDGYPRVVPAGTPVYINGRIVPISGRVSMDMITVDLGPDAMDKVGDQVEFWGNHIPVAHIAKAAGTIAYDLVIKLTKRVVRTAINSSQSS